MGIAKRSEADGAGNLSRLAKQPRSGLAFTGWRRPNALWLGCRVAVGVACTPCHVANAGVAAPTVFDKLPRGRSRGVDVPKALILGVIVL